MLYTHSSYFNLYNLNSLKRCVINANECKHSRLKLLKSLYNPYMLNKRFYSDFDEQKICSAREKDDSHLIPMFIESNLSSSKNRETQKWFIVNNDAPTVKEIPMDHDHPVLLRSLNKSSIIDKYLYDVEAKQINDRLISENIIKKMKNSIQVQGWNKLKDYFLPFNYPNSVASDYLNFYKWIFLQNIAGSCTYVMSMEALLTSVGVSSASFGWAAAITWVLKDGFGCIGMIVYTKIKGNSKSFDSEIFKSKFSADIFHNFGVSLELLTLPFPHLFLLLGSTANVFKGLAGVTNGACKASINKQLAKDNNMGDITAKAYTQGLLSYMIGLGMGIGINLCLPLFSFLPFYSHQLGLWSVFAILSTIHLACGYKGLRGLVLKSLNTNRAYITMNSFIENDCILSPEELSNRSLEPILPFSNEKIPVSIGTSIKDTFNTFNSELMVSLINKFKNEKFIIYGDKHNINVLLQSDTNHMDILKSFFMSMLIRKKAMTEELYFGDLQNYCDHSFMIHTDNLFNEYLEGMKSKGWEVDHILIHVNHHRIDWALVDEN